MIYYNNGGRCPVDSDALYTQQIGPFSSDTALPTIVLQLPTTIDPNTTVVKGRLVNCNNENIMSGYINLLSQGINLYCAVNNGTFQFNVKTCNPNQNSFTMRCAAFGVVSIATREGLLNNGPVDLGIIPVCDVIVDPPDPDGSLLDLDQNTYTYIATGQQTWMQQNLNVSRYSDGTVIPQVSDPAAWASLTTGAWCYFSNNDAAGTTFGKLYNWYAVAGIHDNDPNTPNKTLAPTGWHVPTDAEWTTLTDFLGGVAVAGGKMKTPLNWQIPNAGATNSSGFTAIPGGYRDFNGSYSSSGGFAGWWSATESDAVSAWSRNVIYLGPNASRVTAKKTRGFSIRCIKD